MTARNILLEKMVIESMRGLQQERSFQFYFLFSARDLNEYLKEHLCKVEKNFSGDIHHVAEAFHDAYGSVYHSEGEVWSTLWSIGVDKLALAAVTTPGQEGIVLLLHPIEINHDRLCSECAHLIKGEYLNHQLGLFNTDIEVRISKNRDVIGTDIEAVVSSQDKRAIMQLSHEFRFFSFMLTSIKNKKKVIFWHYPHDPV